MGNTNRTENQVPQNNSSTLKRLFPDQQQQFDFKQQVHKFGEEIQLKVSTFNYGYCDSPFQYYDQDDHYQDQKDIYKTLQQIFVKLLKKQIESDENILCKKEQLSRHKKLTDEYKKYLTQIVAAYDRRYRSNRYSPLYYANIGTHDIKFFDRKEQFYRKWITLWKQTMKNGNIKLYNKDSSNLTEQDYLAFQILCKFDWVCFEILLLFSYCQPNRLRSITIEQAENQIREIIEKKTNAEYRRVLAKQFDKKVINQKYKIQKLIKNFEKLDMDIIFLQNSDRKIISQIEKKTNKYRIASSSNVQSIILISWKFMAKMWPYGKVKPLQYYNQVHFSNKQIKKRMKQLQKREPVMKKAQKTSYGQFFGGNNRSIIQFEPSSSPLKPYQNPLPKGQNIKQKNNNQGQLIFKNLKSVDTSNDITQNPQQMVLQVQSNQKQSSNQSNESSEDSQSDEYFSSSDQSSQQQHIGQTSNIVKHILKHQKNKKRQLGSLITKIRKKKIPTTLYEKLIQLDGAYVQFFDRLILISWQSQIKNDPNYIKELLEIIQKDFSEYDVIIGVQTGYQNIIKNLDQRKVHVFPGQQNQFEKPYRRETFLKINTLSKVYGLQQSSLEQTIKSKFITSHIITTLPIAKNQILNIQNKEISINSQILVPTQAHPYQHFIIASNILYDAYKKIKSKKLKQQSLNITYTSFQQSRNIA